MEILLNTFDYKDQDWNFYIDEIMDELRSIYKKKGESHV